jgi:hypothetical protein
MAVVAPSHPRNALSISLYAATLLACVLAGCSSDTVFVTADYARCRELGFRPGNREYDVCLSEVHRRRMALAAAPDELRD